jgi:hypothetical protein
VLYYSSNYFLNWSLILLFPDKVSLFSLITFKDRPLRLDLAEEYVRERDKYNENADKFTKDFAEKR